MVKSTEIKRKELLYKIQKIESMLNNVSSNLQYSLPESEIDSLRDFSLEGLSEAGDELIEAIDMCVDFFEEYGNK